MRTNHVAVATGAGRAAQVVQLHGAALNVLDGAIDTLTASQDDQAVHAARRATKRVRAALRLMRECLGPHVYRRENRRVRDAAKPLTNVRDGFVLRERLRSMPARSVARRRGLDAEYRRERVAVEGHGARAVVARLRIIREQLAVMPALNSEAASAVAGLRKSYKAGRNACAQARTRDDQALHEWRKQAKYLLNQLELVHVVYKVRFKTLHRRAERLAGILGDDHDLRVLLSRLRRYDATNQHLRKYIKKRRHKLQAGALQLGRKLYRRSAKRIGTRVAAKLGIDEQHPAHSRPLHRNVLCRAGVSRSD
jgi:CHAD domain-containing protein